MDDDLVERAMAVVHTRGSSTSQLVTAGAILAREVERLQPIAETALRMYASIDAGDREDAAHASRTLRDLVVRPLT